MLHSIRVQTSPRFYPWFILVMASSPGFGSLACYLSTLNSETDILRCQSREFKVNVRPLRLAFTLAASPQGLNRATCIELVGSFFNRNAVTLPPRGGFGLRLLVSVWFQILFHRPPGLLFTFPSRYWFTIDHKKYLALRHSRRCFIRDFSSPVLLTKVHHEELRKFRIRGYHPLWLIFPDDSTIL